MPGIGGVRRLCSCPRVSALSAVLCIIILCGNNEPEAKLPLFRSIPRAHRLHIPNGFLVCSSLFGDRLWRRDEELWRYARARVGQGEEKSDGCAEAHSARAVAH